MPCCCVKVLNLCNVAICGTLEIAQAATGPSDSGSANVYTLLLDYLETAITLTQQQADGENIRFDVSSLNENFQYTGQIFDAEGNKVTIISDSEDYDCVKFKTIMQLATPTGLPTPPVLDIPETVVIESAIDGVISITGTLETVSGLSSGSNTVTSNAFIGVRVIVIRGNVPIPGIDPLDGSQYFTKALMSDFITLSEDLAPEEFIRIQTIPQ